MGRGGVGGDARRRASSDSRTLSSRACSRVEMDSPIREMAALSGLMLKLLIVWLMSCGGGVLSVVAF